MEKLHLPQWVYVWLPYLVISFIMTGIIVVLILIQCCSLTGLKGALRVQMMVIKIMIRIAVILFGPSKSILRYDQEPKENLDTPELYIRRRRVPTVWIKYLGYYGISFSFYAALVFWDIVFLAKTHDCDEDTIDCFLIEPIGNYSVGSPITDCGLFEDIEMHKKIVCYSFTFNIGAGLAAIGGLIALIYIVMKVISCSCIKLYETIGVKHRCCKYYFLCLALTRKCSILLILMLLTIIFYMITRGYLSMSYVNAIKFFLCIITFVIGLSFPWYLFVDEDKEDSDGTAISTEETQTHYELIV